MVARRVSKRLTDVGLWDKPSAWRFYGDYENNFNNRVAWQASNMRARGFIKKGSVRGLWEITDEGRKWLDDQTA